MGKVRPITIKRAARELVEKYEELLSIDFEGNKKAVDNYMLTGSKRIRNRTAGYVTRLMRRKADIESRSVLDLPDDEYE